MLIAYYMADLLLHVWKLELYVFNLCRNDNIFTTLPDFTIQPPYPAHNRIHLYPNFVRKALPSLCTGGCDRGRRAVQCAPRRPYTRPRQPPQLPHHAGQRGVRAYREWSKAGKILNFCPIRNYNLGGQYILFLQSMKYAANFDAANFNTFVQLQPLLPPDEHREVERRGYVLCSQHARGIHPPPYYIILDSNKVSL